MLQAGDVRVTVTDIRTGEHITVRFKAMRDNREGEGKNWLRVAMDEHPSHVFVEVPSASGDFPDKIGTFYPRTGAFYSDRMADPDRVDAAMLAARWLNEGAQAISRIGHRRFQEEAYCGICGRALTDPESIDRGIGPECFGRQTDSQHQVKEVPKSVSPEERTLIEEILAAVSDLSPVGQARIRDELNMWKSQERQ
jgi:hypothetical protein